MTKNRPNGLGFWMAFATHPALKDQTWAQIAAKCKLLGANWVAWRTTDPRFNGASLEAAVRAFHAVGILFYGWHYSYPDANRVATQVAHMVRCQNAGADGHIVNAEIEFTGRKLEAVRLGQAIRTVMPDWYVAHAPLGWISYHPTWPYEEFDAFTDDVHPQMYWTELKHGAYSTEFRTEITKWMGGYRHGGNDPAEPWVLRNKERVCPIGVTYGKGDLVGTKQPPGALKVDDVRSFLEGDVQTLPCFSLYSLEVATPAVLEYLRTTWSWEAPPPAA